MHVPSRVCLAVASLVGIASGSVYFLYAGWWAHVETTGEPKFEMPVWWMLGESMIVGVVCAVLVYGVGIGSRWLRSAITRHFFFRAKF